MKIRDLMIGDEFTYTGVTQRIIFIEPSYSFIHSCNPGAGVSGGITVLSQTELNQPSVIWTKLQGINKSPTPGPVVTTGGLNIGDRFFLRGGSMGSALVDEVEIVEIFDLLIKVEYAYQRSPYLMSVPARGLQSSPDFGGWISTSTTHKGSTPLPILTNHSQNTVRRFSNTGTLVVGNQINASTVSAVLSGQSLPPGLVVTKWDMGSNPNACPTCSGEIEHKTFSSFSYDYCPACKEDVAVLRKKV